MVFTNDATRKYIINTHIAKLFEQLFIKPNEYTPSLGKRFLESWNIAFYGNEKEKLKDILYNIFTNENERNDFLKIIYEDNPKLFSTFMLGGLYNAIKKYDEKNLDKEFISNLFENSNFDEIKNIIVEGDKEKLEDLENKLYNKLNTNKQYKIGFHYMFEMQSQSETVGFMVLQDLRNLIAKSGNEDIIGMGVFGVANAGKSYVMGSIATGIVNIIEKGLKILKLNPDFKQIENVIDETFAKVFNIPFDDNIGENIQKRLNNFGIDYNKFKKELINTLPQLAKKYKELKLNKYSVQNIENLYSVFIDTSDFTLGQKDTTIPIPSKDEKGVMLGFDKPLRPIFILDDAFVKTPNEDAKNKLLMDLLNATTVDTRDEFLTHGLYISGNYDTHTMSTLASMGSKGYITSATEGDIKRYVSRRPFLVQMAQQLDIENYPILDKDTIKNYAKFYNIFNIALQTIATIRDLENGDITSPLLLELAKEVGEEDIKAFVENIKINNKEKLNEYINKSNRFGYFILLKRTLDKLIENDYNGLNIATLENKSLQEYKKEILNNIIKNLTVFYKDKDFHQFVNKTNFESISDIIHKEIYGNFGIDVIETTMEDGKNKINFELPYENKITSDELSKLHNLLNKFLNKANIEYYEKLRTPTDFIEVFVGKDTQGEEKYLPIDRFRKYEKLLINELKGLTKNRDYLRVFGTKEEQQEKRKKALGDFVKFYYLLKNDYKALGIDEAYRNKLLNGLDKALKEGKLSFLKIKGKPFTSITQLDNFISQNEEKIKEMAYNDISKIRSFDLETQFKNFIKENKEKFGIKDDKEIENLKLDDIFKDIKVSGNEITKIGNEINKTYEEKLKFIEKTFNTGNKLLQQQLLLNGIFGNYSVNPLHQIDTTGGIELDKLADMFSYFDIEQIDDMNFANFIKESSNRKEQFLGKTYLTAYNNMQICNIVKYDSGLKIEINDENIKSSRTFKQIVSLLKLGKKISKDDRSFGKMAISMLTSLYGFSPITFGILNYFGIKPKESKLEIASSLQDLIDITVNNIKKHIKENYGKNNKEFYKKLDEEIKKFAKIYDKNKNQFGEELKELGQKLGVSIEQINNPYEAFMLGLFLRKIKDKKDTTKEIYKGILSKEEMNKLNEITKQLVDNPNVIDAIYKETELGILLALIPQDAIKVDISMDDIFNIEIDTEKLPKNKLLEIFNNILTKLKYNDEGELESEEFNLGKDCIGEMFSGTKDMFREYIETARKMGCCSILKNSYNNLIEAIQTNITELLDNNDMVKKFGIVERMFSALVNCFKG